MRRCLPVVLIAGTLALAAATPARSASLQDPQEPVPADFTPFTTEQLQQLVAPVALYADPLLAQVLLAATFPDQIKAAAEYVQANGTSGIDDQSWDVSVKAVAHYPTVLNLMNTRIDWTTSLGQAYAAQSTEVMTAVQHMRQLAQAQGNLPTTAEQQVVADGDYIRIWPAQTRYVYVPVYDPDLIYYRPVFFRPGFHLYFSWGVPFAIGPWLIYDWDWPGHRIYYTGWYGGGWIARSRPFIYYTSVYINPIHNRVWYGRDVMWRHVDYGRVYPRDRSWAARGRGYDRDGRGYDRDGRGYDRNGRDYNRGGVRPGQGLEGARPTGRNAQPRDAQPRDGQRERTAGIGPSQATTQPATTPPQTYRQWGSQLDPPRWSPPAGQNGNGGESGRSAQERTRIWDRNSGWSKPAEQIRPEAQNRQRSGWTPPATQYGNVPGVVVERGERAADQGARERGGWSPGSMPRVERPERSGWGSSGGNREAAPRVERGDRGGRMSAPPQRAPEQRAPEQRPQQSSGDQGGRGAHRR